MMTICAPFSPLYHIIFRRRAQRGSSGLLVVLGVSLALFSAGCATKPGMSDLRKLGVDPPRDWAADVATAPVLETGWWESFHEPELSDYVWRVLAGNLDVDAAAARLASAEAAVKIAKADFLPTIGAGFDAGRSRQVFTGLPIPGAGVLSSTSNSFGISVNTSWEADVWGRVKDQTLASKADLRQARLSVDAARQSLAGQAVKVWLAAAEACMQVDLAFETVQSFEDTYVWVRNRFDQGLVPSVDVRLAATNIEVSEAQLAAREEVREVLQRQLEILAGAYPAGTFKLPGYLPHLPQRIPAGLPAELLARRPDLVAAEWQILAADYRVGEAKKLLLPRLSLTAAGGTRSDELENLLKSDYLVWNLVSNITAPLFQGGKLRANVELRKAQLEEALKQYAASALKAFHEVESTLAVEEYLARQEKQLRAAIREAEQAREIAEEAYRAGLGSYLAVLESQRGALQSRSQLLTIQRRRLENRVDLHMALGGGFATSESTPKRVILANDQNTESEDNS